MDAFESLVGELLRAEGYWVHCGYKIELTTEEKRSLNNPSMPRPEIDLIAYRPGHNELLAIECKSYFDSGGVHARDLVVGGKNEHRYKMFVNPALRQLVLQKLAAQMRAAGAITEGVAPRLCMAYGHASVRNEAEIRSIFTAQGWGLFGPQWVRSRLSWMARQSYDNQIASVVAKLILPRRGVDPYQLDSDGALACP